MPFPLHPTHRRLVPTVVLALAIGGVLMSPNTPAQSATTQIDLSAMKPGKAPDDFAFSRTGSGDVGEWRVMDDPTASNQRVIAQTSTDKTDYRFPIAVYQRISAKNVDVKVRFKPVGGKVDQAGGIVVRLTTPDDYYVVRANALEDNVRFYRVVKGKRQELKGANTKVAANEWHNLELRADGDRFTVSFDGRQLFTAQDATFTGEGRVGLWTKADSVTYFDTIAITPLD
jgi:glycosyl hydrolase family 59 (putative galactocerebrosidase)